MKISIFIILVLPFFIFENAKAEPWLANRSAQNCTACHAPGRVNRKPSKRRCTLSCQGCHVNPNGGGLRNAYGKWNSERWVRSFYSDLTWNKKSPAPLEKQHYAKEKMSKKRKVHYAKHGAMLVEFPGVVKNEKEYFESSNYKSAKGLLDEMSRISRDDPFRIEKSSFVQAGGDLRFFFIKKDGDNIPEKLKDGTFFPMVFDFGLRMRPLKENISLVYEGRAINTNVPNPSSMDNLFAGSAITRSAYLLVDDLWYNSYVQYGFFRPMFGLYNPNHTAMISDYTQIGIRTRVKALGLGTAPNVPFAILNVIMPTENAASTDIASESGYNLNLGLRFVSYGAHLTGSYWATQNETATTPRKRMMWNVNAGGTLGRFIFNGEITSVRREVMGVVNRLDQTTLMGLDIRYRFWREMYLIMGATQANAGFGYNNPLTSSTTQLSPGTGSELTFGLKAFTISGLEFETLWISRLNKEDGYADTKAETLQFQMHAYF